MSTVELPLLFKQQPIVIVMGVCGSGKSTVGSELATRMGAQFLDGDDFHPVANVKKMQNRIALTDGDRWPWLSELGATIQTHARADGGVVASCSALKRAYRQHLSEAIELAAVFVLLDGSRETLLQRMENRTDHYMPSSLLDSQLDLLERPSLGENVLVASFEPSLDEIVSSILSSLGGLKNTTLRHKQEN